jgi:hypothetical protein
VVVIVPLPDSTPLPTQAFIAAAKAVLADKDETARVVHVIASELDPDAFTGHGYGMGAAAQAREQALERAAGILDRIARSHA